MNVLWMFVELALWISVCSLCSLEVCLLWNCCIAIVWKCCRFVNPIVLYQRVTSFFGPICESDVIGNVKFCVKDVSWVFQPGTLVCLYLYLICMCTDLHWSACSTQWLLKWSVCESSRFHWNKTCSIVYCEQWSLWEWMSTESGDEDWSSLFTEKTLVEAKCTCKFQRKNHDNWLFTRCFIFGMGTNNWVYCM